MKKLLIPFVLILLSSCLQTKSEPSIQNETTTDLSVLETTPEIVLKDVTLPDLQESDSVANDLKIKLLSKLNLIKLIDLDSIWWKKAFDNHMYTELRKAYTENYPTEKKYAERTWIIFTNKTMDWFLQDRFFVRIKSISDEILLFSILLNTEKEKSYIFLATFDSTNDSVGVLPINKIVDYNINKKEMSVEFKSDEIIEYVYDIKLKLVITE